MSKLVVDVVSKRYPYIKEDLFFDLSFNVDVGERVGIVAEKQCGKSSITKMLAGLTTPTKGKILLDGKELLSVPPSQRGIGVVFDDFALIKNKNVFKNVCFPLKVRKVANFKQVATEALKKFCLTEQAKTKPKKLTSLQKLKTAFARLYPRQDVSLLVLDDICRSVEVSEAEKQLQVFLQGREVAILQTATEVDHLCFCDKVCVLADGTIHFVGTFDEAKRYIVDTKCFDKFGINDDIQKIVNQK